MNKIKYQVVENTGQYGTGYPHVTYGKWFVVSEASQRNNIPFKTCDSEERANEIATKYNKEYNKDINVIGLFDGWGKTKTTIK